MAKKFEVNLPDLTIRNVTLGRTETPWDLCPLLYAGGAGARVDKVAGAINAGELGSPLLERIDLVRKIHEEIDAALASGGSKMTARTQIYDLRYFFSWADASQNRLELASIENVYLHWSDHLLHRVRISKDLKEAGAYRCAKTVGAVLDKVLERSTPIVCNTRLRLQRKRKRLRGLQAEKQNLQETFEFGHALLDIADGLDVKAIWGPLPVHVRLRSGQVLEDWSGLMSLQKVKWTNPHDRKQRHNAKISMRVRAAYENDRTLRTRRSLVNLRIEAELLFFIGQTGMNLAQAHQLKVGRYSYKSSIDGYEVRDYKHRRKGEVMFEIFSEYKEVFDRYLLWRNEIFPDDAQGMLFPIIRAGGRAEDTAPRFTRVRSCCKKLGLRFITPAQLRNTRVNWMLRRSCDPDLTAEQAQHSAMTLLRYYEEPNLQVAMVEIARFWSSHDPALPCPAPGACNAVPVPMVNAPPEAPVPDCIRPAGCLWCEHHRDIDSQDYVWSLASMRHLKILALKGFPPSNKSNFNPVRRIEMVLERLTGKLRWFKNSNDLRQCWVVEALARIEEAFYHPDWHYLIVAVEGD